jgi:hypothetical protein
MRRIALLIVSLAACVAPAETDDPTTKTPVLPPGTCTPAAGKLTVYALPPPISLDWSTPNVLLDSVIASRSEGANLVSSGKAAMAHSIGHVNVQLDCGDFSIALTGQTDQGGADWQAATDGAGLLLRDTAGAMDAMPRIGDAEETIADIAARQASGKLSQISFVVNQQMCERLKTFHDAYVESGAYKHYNGSMRARRLEGAGCAIFGAGMVDVGGLLRRSLFTPEWARTEMIGSARIADFLGDGKYQYGGNMTARDESGTHWVWPQGIDVPVSNTTPVYIYSDVLDAWNGPEDAEFAVPSLTGRMKTQLPFTIYDPQMMSEWAERVWTQATNGGTATSLGVPWTASTVGQAHEVTYDAHCVQPQTIGFTEDNDDLFEDSDAPQRD